MAKNVGRADAWIRGALAIVLFVLAAIFNASPVLSLGAALVGLVLLGTALTGTCPLYRLLGLSSRERETGRHGSSRGRVAQGPRGT